MTRRAMPLAGILLVVACGEISVEHEARVAVEPGSEQVRFADLDGCCDLLIGGPSRGQVDVVRRHRGRWEAVGSFFAAAHPIRDLSTASVGGRPSVFVRSGSAQVNLLTADLLDPHRLRDPVRVFEDGDVRDIASADLDRDGIDELVVAVSDRIEIVDRTEWAVFEDPSERPRVSRHEIGGGFPARAVAVGDATGDGVPDVVAFHRDEPRARIYDSPGLDRDSRPSPRDVGLSAPAVDAVSVRCLGRPAVAILEDGSVVGVGAEDGQSAEWALAGEAEAVRGGGEVVVVAYRDGGEMTLHDGCGRFGESLGLSSKGVLDLAFTPRERGARRMAVLREGARTVSVYRVESPF